jgi:endoglucanase
MNRRAQTRTALLGMTAGLVGLLAVALAGVSGASPRAHASYAQQCSSSDYSPHNPSNPLDTPNFSGSNPLSNAHLFLESPWLFGGDAANTIANEIGLGHLTRQTGGQPVPWAQFKQRVNSMHLSRDTSFRVHELEKIGNYPQSHQFSLYTAGGSGDQIFTQTQNYLCRMQRTDSSAAAVITTYFIAHRGCDSGAQPKFQSEVDALKAAVGRFPALIFVEEDALDTMCWSNSGVVSGRTALLKYEIDQLSQLPHALLYVEGGTSDANSPGQIARVLNNIDAGKIRGFFLNDTHFNWASKEIKFANQVSQQTHGLHFVVDTRGAGQGPILNPHPVTQGIEQLCNPAHRGLGPKPGASNGKSYGMYSKYLDGFAWVTTPGESTASTCPGRSGHWAQSGIFDESIAIDFAVHANDRIGSSPPYKSRPW